MICLAGEKPNTLVTIASRGYAQGGAGAEVHFGEGIIGVVAEARKPIRISGLMRGMLYAYAVAKRAQERGWTPDRRVPLPGLENPMSQLGVPLVVRGDLVGVLCIESETPYRFHEEDKATIELLGSTPRHRDPEHAAAGERRGDGGATQRGPARARAGGANRKRRELAYTATTKC